MSFRRWMAVLAPERLTLAALRAQRALQLEEIPDPFDEEFVEEVERRLQSMYETDIFEGMVRRGMIERNISATGNTVYEKAKA